MVLIICGFSGSGKSYWGKILSKKLELVFFDLDDEILANHGDEFQFLGELIEAKGWEWFRKEESKILEKLIQKNPNCVISLGGGSLNEASIRLIKGSSMIKLLWIDLPFENCWQRIKEDQNRPLVKKGKIYCNDLYKGRKKYYQRAEIKINPLVNTVEEIIQAVHLLDQELQ